MCRQFEIVPEAELAEVVRALAAGTLVDSDATVRQFELVDMSAAAAEKADEGAGADGGQTAMAFPGSRVGVLALEASAVRVMNLTWGFDVSWQQGPVFNTRIESALDGSSMWRDAIRTGRCIVPTRGFYETHRTETVRSAKTGRRIKRRYRFARPGGEVFFLAAVAEAGRFSVVTTEPNAAVSPVHNRMPIALDAHEAMQWLAGDFAALADRGSFELAAQGEEEAAVPVEPDGYEQLALF